MSKNEVTKRVEVDNLLLVVGMSTGGETEVLLSKSMARFCPVMFGALVGNIWNSFLATVDANADPEVVRDLFMNSVLRRIEEPKATYKVEKKEDILRVVSISKDDEQERKVH